MFILPRMVVFIQFLIHLLCTVPLPTEFYKTFLSMPKEGVNIMPIENIGEVEQVYMRLLRV